MRLNLPKDLVWRKTRGLQVSFSQANRGLDRCDKQNPKYAVSHSYARPRSFSLEHAQLLAKGNDLKAEVMVGTKKAMKHVSKPAKNGIIGRDLYHRVENGAALIAWISSLMRFWRYTGFFVEHSLFVGMYPSLTVHLSGARSLMLHQYSTHNLFITMLKWYAWQDLNLRPTV
jgi:hypothetical protein